MNNRGVRSRVRVRAGFTLMEMLIVVAIIAALVAIAIPVVSGSLEKSKEAADLAGIRGAYAEVLMTAMTEDEETELTVNLAQNRPGWQTASAQSTLEGLAEAPGNVVGQPQKGGKCTVKRENEQTYFIFEGALPVSVSQDDYSNPVVMADKYGRIVSYILKADASKLPKTISGRSYAYCGEGETDADKVKIYTVHTRDGETSGEIKRAMKEAGYSDDEIEHIYGPMSYAYLDENFNLLGYHGPGSGGQTKLYIVGYGSSPVSVDGAIGARSVLAEYVQKGTVTTP